MSKEKKTEKIKIRRGDRIDGVLIRDLDTMHRFMPYILPNRADNEAVMSETIDMTELDKYIDKKNAENPDFKYTAFHAIIAAFSKAICLRPQMNYFYIGHRLYERRDISFSFVVKKEFEDKSYESLAILKIDRDGTPILEQVHGKIKKIVTSVRVHNSQDKTTDILDTLVKLPRPILRFFVRIINHLDYHGRLPKSLLYFDPYHSTAFVANLGSIKITAQYHHLTNWGTNSLFIIIGEKKKRPFFNDDGTYEMKDSIEFGLTIDERIGDGVYFSKTVKLLRYMLEHPETLETAVAEPIDVDLSLTNKK